ncbi:hypothetical protein R6Q59_035312 [Mikania micrantha]
MESETIASCQRSQQQTLGMNKGVVDRVNVNFITTIPTLNNGFREDLWKQIFLVGTEDAFEEGGELHDKKVSLFCCTEPPMLLCQGEIKAPCIPVVIAVVSPFPPSDKIGIKSVQMESEEIVDMKRMKMDWVPYIPLGKRGSSVERLNSQIFILSCVQRSYLMLESRVWKMDLNWSSWVIWVTAVWVKMIVCEFDWEMDELEDFTNGLISDALSEDQRDAFKEFLREKVREGRRANREERESRARARAELSEDEVAAFENMRFYKFYPDVTPDTLKVSYINRYYGKAHEVF